ncbi:MAG TPA: TA system VapC family ribonuclease toxin [Thermoanaerobaculia bacterium]|nr:TA system VapC family ribonuclease toxin [Thermoanaerobaculia bacterium]
MIAVDTNLLVYAHREDSEFHDEASLRVRDLAEGTSPWAIPWPCIHEFLAVVTHPRIYAPPTPVSRAIDQVEAWMQSPVLRLIGEDTGYWAVLRGILLSAKATGGRVHDARIAALSLRWRVSELWSADRDFSRFPALRVVNPI